MFSTRISDRWVPLAIGALLLVALASCQAAPPPPADGAPVQPAAPAVAISTPAISAIPTPRVAPAALDSRSPTATALPPTPTPIPTPRVAAGDRDVAPRASVSASSGQDSARNAIDGKLDSMWSSGASAPQSYTLTLDHTYLVDAIQLVVAQTPAGQTTHEIWLGDSSGKLTLYKKLVNTWTAEGQVIDVPVQPARLVDRVLVRTDASPSFVAWREIRVYGQPPSTATSAALQTAGATPVVVDWPRIATVGSFSFPTQVTNAGDGSGRLFVVERTGIIRILSAGTPQTRPFLDLADRVKCCDGEQGLFSVAFPSDFARKQYFYVAYTSKTRGPVGDVVVSRFHVSANPNVADPASEQVILDVPKQNAAHNGGHLAFGPKDGYLYVGIGDGGLQNDPTNEAQSLASLKGKILRIDTESGASPYAIPPSNPFVHTPGARPEIWAYGLRNPWQFSFDTQTGDLYVADVGENNAEEIDFQPAASPGGENYGWHIMEGDHCYLAANCDQRGLTFPVTEYTHADGNCAVIGGQVYRGKAYPAMQGIFFYGDLCSGRVWGLRQVGGQWETNLLTKEPFQISGFGTDESGTIYLTDFSDGAIFRLVEPSAT